MRYRCGRCCAAERSIRTCAVGRRWKALILLAFLTFLACRCEPSGFVKDISSRPGDLRQSSLMGVGSILGSLTIAGLGNIRHKGRLALTMLLCLGAGIAGFALSKFLWLSFGLVAIVGFSMMGVFATVSSLVQLNVTEEMRGRVMSVYNCAFRGGMPMGNIASGWLIPLFSAPLVLAINGVLLIVMALFFLLVKRRVATL